jgi:hypothetical protein
MLVVVNGFVIRRSANVCFIDKHKSLSMTLHITLNPEVQVGIGIRTSVSPMKDMNNSS